MGTKVRQPRVSCITRTRTRLDSTSDIATTTPLYSSLCRLDEPFTPTDAGPPTRRRGRVYAPRPMVDDHGRNGGDRDASVVARAALRGDGVAVARARPHRR